MPPTASSLPQVAAVLELVAWAAAARLLGAAEELPAAALVAADGPLRRLLLLLHVQHPAAWWQLLQPQQVGLQVELSWQHEEPLFHCAGPQPAGSL